MWCSVDDYFSLSSFEAEELVQVMYFGPYVFFWFKGHEDELAVIGSEEDFSVVGVIECVFFDI